MSPHVANSNKVGHHWFMATIFTFIDTNALFFYFLPCKSVERMYSRNSSKVGITTFPSKISWANAADSLALSFLPRSRSLEVLLPIVDSGWRIGDSKLGPCPSGPMVCLSVRWDLAEPSSKDFSEKNETYVYLVFDSSKLFIEWLLRIPSPLKTCIRLLYCEQKKKKNGKVVVKF